MIKRSLVLAAALAALAPAAAQARTHGVNYQGKTSSGTKITFTLNGSWIDQTFTHVVTSCGSAQGGSTTVGQTTYSPPFRFRLGYDAAASTSDPTYHYHFSSHRRGKRITGKLSVNWSLLGSDGWGGYRIVICQGNASFSALPKG
jgi:hypothetical protein